MIYIVSGNDAERYPSLMKQVYRLRHEVFVNEMGWKDLYSPDGLERDQFDRPDAVHFICVRDGKVVGYQRGLPTVKPHLLSDVFPELCEGPVPRGLDTYELSRHCVAPGYREGRRGVSSVGSELMVGGVEWGLACGANKAVTEVETIWVLRWLQLKFLIRPLGYATQIGDQLIVALLMEFNRSTLQVIREYRKHSAPVVTYLGELEEQHMAMAV
ncbi:MAG: acyl-homoserine-lactone synthase [Rhodomicrobium sp.]